jgi:hypothetical protein
LVDHIRNLGIQNLVQLEDRLALRHGDPEEGLLLQAQIEPQEAFAAGHELDLLEQRLSLCGDGQVRFHASVFQVQDQGPGQFGGIGRLGDGQGTVRLQNDPGINRAGQNRDFLYLDGSAEVLGIARQEEKKTDQRDRLDHPFYFHLNAPPGRFA